MASTTDSLTAEGLEDGLHSNRWLTRHGGNIAAQRQGASSPPEPDCEVERAVTGKVREPPSGRFGDSVLPRLQHLGAADADASASRSLACEAVSRENAVAHQPRLMAAEGKLTSHHEGSNPRDASHLGVMNLVLAARRSGRPGRVSTGFY